MSSEDTANILGYQEICPTGFISSENTESIRNVVRSGSFGQDQELINGGQGEKMALETNSLDTVTTVALNKPVDGGTETDNCNMGVETDDPNSVTVDSAIKTYMLPVSKNESEVVDKLDGHLQNLNTIPNSTEEAEKISRNHTAASTPTDVSREESTGEISNNHPENNLGIAGSMNTAVPTTTSNVGGAALQAQKKPNIILMDKSLSPGDEYDLRLRSQAWTEVMSKRSLSFSFAILAAKVRKSRKSVIWKKESIIRKKSKIMNWTRYEEVEPGAWVVMDHGANAEGKRLAPDDLQDWSRQESDRGYDSSRDDEDNLRERRKSGRLQRHNRVNRHTAENGEYIEGGVSDRFQPLTTSSTGRVVKKIDYAQFM